MSKLDKEIITYTFKVWKATRLNGVSASMADGGGDLDQYLLQVFDRVVREQKEKDDATAG